MRFRHLVPILFLCSCGIFSGDKKDEYVAFRILNNELGAMLEKYHENFIKYAQNEVDVWSNQKCKPMTAECRLPIKQFVAKKYADRERTYNMCAEVQHEAMRLLDRADTLCKASPDVNCDEAKLDALDKRGAVQSAVELVSEWITE